jgi:diaminopimelate decarboxylase
LLVLGAVAVCRYAREHGVEYTTFDCVSELEKIAAGYPAFKCVLRIRCDDADAKINLGLKYGADLCDVPMLMETARNLGLQVSRHLCWWGEQGVSVVVLGRSC